MKKLILITSIILFVSCKEPDRKCADFKTGKFKFEAEIDGVLKTTYFERNDSIEIETYDGKTDTASIRWVNDCEYILKKLNPKNMAEEKSISMRILSTTENSYTFEFGIVGMPDKQKGTAIKL
ncbi:DNA topoisomerase IV [Flavobacterium algicola]|uniref:DNA topoisomerase IV n=1 Tax=Flavobacterium algicola TaxID=556529 RepID=UPI001EFE27CD|nr:DNA topoisomerase IV [Flavobacterium algicola]MCG9793357.1 DNA topoisomerase IV [Flavobacterium algicola]